MSSAPGRRELRWFALCAGLASLFNLSNVVVTLRVPVDLIFWTSRFSLFFGGLHSVVWLKYAAVDARRRLRPWELTLAGVGTALSLLALVPGVVLENRLFVREVRWLGISYADPPPTAFGNLVFGYHACALIIVFTIYAVRAFRTRSGVTQCIAIGALLAGAVHDSLASSGVLRSPYLLDLAVLVMVLAVGGSLTKSFVASARALELSSRKLAVAHEELVKKERLVALGELAAVIAHEVRNPLAVVFNATAGLRRANVGADDQTALTNIIQEEAERLRDMVDDLLEFARPRPPVFAETPLEPLVRSAVEAARAASDVPEEIVFTAEPKLPLIQCDERLVRAAVINLVTNALVAPERRSSVRVVLRQELNPDHQELSVSIDVIDDGIGVPKDQRERIFTPFYSTRPRGTGLGLAIVRSSADAHAGDVILTDTPGGGATFTLRLPRR
jgi:two-component system sensor histidine kinase HydH